MDLKNIFLLLPLPGKKRGEANSTDSIQFLSKNIMTKSSTTPSTTPSDTVSTPSDTLHPDPIPPHWIMTGSVVGITVFLVAIGSGFHYAIRRGFGAIKGGTIQNHPIMNKNKIQHQLNQLHQQSQLQLQSSHKQNPSAFYSRNSVWTAFGVATGMVMIGAGLTVHVWKWGMGVQSVKDLPMAFYERRSKRRRGSESGDEVGDGDGEEGEEKEDLMEEKEYMEMQYEDTAQQEFSRS